MSRPLILIKHARPLVDPATPSHEWKLSEEGRRQCAALAEKLRSMGPTLVVSSDEPKAAETGELLAEHLGISCRTAEGLHEHDRSNEPQMRTGEFISAMSHFFRNPGQLVLGRETARQCARRFAAALEAVRGEHPDEALALVTHGTVLALYLEEAAGEDAFQLWRRMQLPSYAVVGEGKARVVDRL